MPQTRVTMPSAIPKATGLDSIVIVTHGYAAAGATADVSWVNDLASAIQQRVGSNWYVHPYIWTEYASGIPSTALVSAWVLGVGLGQSIADQNWTRIHLIGHSAGARFVESAAKHIKAGSPNTIVHCTFLDPYHSTFLLGLDDTYGAHADWADCYYTQDVTGGGTGGREPYAFNVDVTWLDPTHRTLLYGAAPVAISTDLHLDFRSHQYAHEFFTQTVTNIDTNWCAADYGFPLSAEAGGQLRWTNHPTGNATKPFVLCGPSNAIPAFTVPPSRLSKSD
jgi:hypothetical protein